MPVFHRRPAFRRRPTFHERPGRAAYRWLRRRHAGRPDPDRGASIVELAILWPIVLLVIFGAVQVATYFTARTVALSAAQVGVATQRQYDAAPGSGSARAEAFLAEAGDWLVDAQVGEPVHTQEEVSITVSGEALSVLPGVSWEVQQTAHGTVERFTEAP